jgi:hypothetical protein
VTRKEAARENSFVKTEQCCILSKVVVTQVCTWGKMSQDYILAKKKKKSLEKQVKLKEGL